jgi:DNA-binding transcriptional LysR family regulator
MQPVVKPLSHQVDLNLLELFDTIYRTRNMTAAGARLGLSQPAVSHGLAKLRDAYQDQLFVRVQRGVQPTALADQIALPVASALELVRKTMTKGTFSPELVQRKFRIAMTDAGERRFLPPLTRLFERNAPGITLETLAPGLSELSEALATGDVDLAVGYIPGLGKQVYQQVLFTEHYVYLMRKDHPAMDESYLTAQFRNLGHVVVNPPATQHSATIERVLISPKVNAKIMLRVGSLLCVGPIVKGSDLVAPVPSNLAGMVASDLGLGIRSAPINFPTFEISMYWHARYHNDSALVWLRETFASLTETPKT